MHTLTRRSAIFFLASAVSTIQAGPLEHYFIQEQNNHPKVRLSDSSIKTQWFSQRLNADDSNTPMFQQRYYVDETFSKGKNDPVFFYICGESACSPNVLNGAIRAYAQHFNAKLVALEHRYYGESQPFKDLSTAHLRFLNTEHALNDLVYFQRAMQHSKQWKGAWFAFGGSYPGSLSAYYRMKYPYMVHGALASSAPVQAKEAFSDYDKHVSQVAGSACANAMREAVHTVESQMHDPEALAHIKQQFSATDIADPRDFLYVLADVAAASIQYGMRDEFCNALSNGSDVVQAYADFAHVIYKRFNIRAVDLSPQVAMDDSLNNATTGIGMRQWYYQSCSEYGYWQIAHPNPEYSCRSKAIDLPYHRSICKRLFHMTSPANTDRFNEDFYRPLFNHLTQRIHFTNGSNDPWSTLSLTPENAEHQNPNLSYTVIKGAAHCDDLRTPFKSDSAALKNARKKTKTLLNAWMHS